MEEIKPTQPSQLTTPAGSASETHSELPLTNSDRKPKLARPLAVGTWDDPSLQRWMGSIIRGSTRSVYRSGFRLYVDYTQLTASQLIDEALEDVKKDQREKTDIVKQRLIGFYSWLIEKAPKKGPGGSETGKLGLSSKICHTYVGAIRSFYSTYDVFIKLSRRSKLPEPKVENPRMILNNEDVKTLLDHTRTIRDKALILVMFQSGMDVSTLCSLKQKDVEGLGVKGAPFALALQRVKTGIEFYTFIGKDSITAILAYLADVKSRGIQLSSNDPLFLKESSKAFSKEGISTNLVQKTLRDAAVRSGLVQAEEGKDFCPLNPHALRESFGSIMSNHGVPDSIVDFWLGHKSKGTDEAYKRRSLEELKHLYSDKEPLLSISNGGEQEKRLRLEIEEKSQQLQNVINRLSSENYELKGKMTELTGKVGEISSFLAEIQPMLSDLLEYKDEWKGYSDEWVEKMAECNKKIKSLKL